jgi:hypothetical protein
MTFESLGFLASQPGLFLVLVPESWMSRILERQGSVNHSTESIGSECAAIRTRIGRSLERECNFPEADFWPRNKVS